MEQNTQDSTKQGMRVPGLSGHASHHPAFPFFGSRRAELQVLRDALASRDALLAETRRVAEAAAVRLAELTDAADRHSRNHGVAQAAFEAREASLLLSHAWL